MNVGDRDMTATDTSALYEIRVGGVLQRPWCGLLGRMESTVVYEGSRPVTVMRVNVPDQSALAGLLDWIFTLNVKLLYVSIVEAT